MRLYDLTQQYSDMLDFLEDDADNEQLQAMLDGLEGKIEEKIENTVKVMKSLESDAAAIDAEIKRLSGRKSALTNNITYLKTNVEQTMLKLGIEKVKGNIYTVAMQNNSPKVNVIDESLIPRSFFKVSVTESLDKKMILDAMKSGEYSGPGAAISQEKSLRVR
ncbi:siphovirus Gp157 family protein [Paenibacillus apii]|uniref:siphovirus Gp157 family protein n=1 Tax=Paenibacillus apii TaxID=1850370 RepID=UPI00143A1173|nr:siphovirus Gp157 family protein [Paenibacillus apii]NJJ38578.1 siphovirus Gp157 family protein [Paenibacillus apii]